MGSADIYHRKESPTQTAADAALQEATGEIWGSVPFGGVRPVAQAYRGPLPSGARGIEFTTDVAPDPQTPPSRARWSGPRQGVRVEGGFAKIDVTVIKNTQV